MSSRNNQLICLPTYLPTYLSQLNCRDTLAFEIEFWSLSSILSSMLDRSSLTESGLELFTSHVHFVFYTRRDDVFRLFNGIAKTAIELIT